jgi:flagellar biosynthesis protein FlhF
MKIRKYVARSMPEALQQVRDDLGEQAVILNTRQLRKNNRFNQSDEPRVEVTAAYDSAPSTGRETESGQQPVRAAPPAVSAADPPSQAGVPAAGQPAVGEQGTADQAWGGVVAQRYGSSRPEIPV